MRDLVHCPFVPGAGRVPEVWAGRVGELADARATARRRLAGVYDRGRAVLGEFGIGKSVLVNRIAEELAADGHWATPTVRLPVNGNAVSLLGEALRTIVDQHGLDRTSALTDLLHRVEHVALPVVGGEIGLRAPEDGSPAYRDVLRLIVHVAHSAHEAGRLLVVRIDEVQNLNQLALSQLLTLLGDALEEELTETDPTGTPRRRSLPLLVYLSGLPDFRERVAAAGATFARRFKTFELDPLDEEELRGALIPFMTDGWPVLTPDGPETVHMAEEAVDFVVASCLGDPFLFQLAGEAAWNAGEGPVISGAEAARGWRLIRREVMSYVEGRLGPLTDLQLLYLRTAAQLDEEERTAAAVAQALGRPSSGALASTAQALDRTHHLIRREAGSIRFRSPAVRAYVTGAWP